MWKTNLFCADAFYLSLAKRIHRCIPNQSFCAFFIFYQLFFCLLVLLSFWESSIALKSYRFLCQKDKSEKNDKQEKFGVSLILKILLFFGQELLITHLWLFYVKSSKFYKTLKNLENWKQSKWIFLLALDLVVNKTSHWTIGVWTVGFKIENSIILAGPGVF